MQSLIPWQRMAYHRGQLSNASTVDVDPTLTCLISLAVSSALPSPISDVGFFSPLARRLCWKHSSDSRVWPWGFYSV